LENEEARGSKAKLKGKGQKAKVKKKTSMRERGGAVENIKPKGKGQKAKGKGEEEDVGWERRVKARGKGSYLLPFAF
jgi:hypothetical protein